MLQAPNIIGFIKLAAMLALKKCVNYCCFLICMVLFFYENGRFFVN
jgi:hypothetical protein